MKSSISLFLFFFIFSLGHIQAFDHNLKENPYNSNGLSFLTLSTGAGVWYNSLQEGMVNEKLPLAIYLEYGKTESSFGFMFGANFYSTYTLDNFLMSPNYFSLALTYQPLKKIIPTRDLHFHTIVGLNIGYSKFTEKEYPGIVDYEHKVEKQFSYGMQLGVGITYMFKNIEIGPMFLYHTGKADFIAGYFSPQTFDVGSLQINILIKYRLVFNRNKNACPAYRNFNRFEL